MALSVGITVGDVVDEPTLRLRLLAGHAGAHRTVLWAATCEMDRPWEWLDAGDLLLVNGHRVPADPEEQAEFVSSLDRAGVSALGIAEHAFAPVLSARMLQTADALAFPLLSVDYNVAFVSISKHVARASSSLDQRNLRLVSRIYDRAKSGSAGSRPFREVLDSLGELVGAQLTVTTLLGTPLLQCPELPQHVHAQLRAEASRLRGHPLPAAIRLHAGSPGVIAMPIPAGRPALLVVIPEERLCDGVVLTHVALLAALELEREGSRTALAATAGTDLMVALLNRRMDTGAAALALTLIGFDSRGELVVATCRAEDGAAMVQTLVDHRIPHLVCVDGSHTFVLLHPDRASLGVLASSAGDAPVGVSAPFVGLRRVPDASTEALFAWGGSATTGLSHYGEATDSLRPGTLTEAQRLVDRVLGPLIRLDRETDGEWTLTLRAFLTHNRSWKRTSEELHLHKQSLVYRIKRIESLLGRSLDDMDSLTEIWLALKSLESLPGDDAPARHE